MNYEEIAYICDCCGERFTLEDGKHMNSDEGPYTLCPGCGSSDIEEAVICPVCRTIWFQFEMDDSGVCPECFKEAKEMYKSAIGSLQPWVRKALDRHYDNIDVTEE